MTNVQKWIRKMRSDKPSEFLTEALPEITDSSKNKVLIVDSDKNTTWGTVAGGELPLADDERILICKEPENS